MSTASLFLRIVCLTVAVSLLTACEPSSGPEGSALDTTLNSAATESVAVSVREPSGTDSVAEATEKTSDPSDGEDGQASPAPAGRRAATKDGLVDITFDDIKLPIQEDMVFRPFMMTETAQALAGKKVRIHGYMLADSETRGIKEFILLKNLECKFGPGGQADHLVNVKVEIPEGAVVLCRVDERGFPVPESSPEFDLAQLQLRFKYLKALGSFNL